MATCPTEYATHLLWYKKKVWQSNWVCVTVWRDWGIIYFSEARKAREFRTKAWIICCLRARFSRQWGKNQTVIALFWCFWYFSLSIMNEILFLLIFYVFAFFTSHRRFLILSCFVIVLLSYCHLLSNSSRPGTSTLHSESGSTPGVSWETPAAVEISSRETPLAETPRPSGGQRRHIGLRRGRQIIQVCKEVVSH